MLTFDNYLSTAESVGKVIYFAGAGYKSEYCTHFSGPSAETLFLSNTYHPLSTLYRESADHTHLEVVWNAVSIGFFKFVSQHSEVHCSDVKHIITTATRADRVLISGHNLPKSNVITLLITVWDQHRAAGMNQHPQHLFLTEHFTQIFTGKSANSVSDEAEIGEGKES